MRSSKEGLAYFSVWESETSQKVGEPQGKLSQKIVPWINWRLTFGSLESTLEHAFPDRPGPLQAGRVFQSPGKALARETSALPCASARSAVGSQRGFGH